MRYPLEGRKTVARLTIGGGLVAGAAGLARGLAKQALGPIALPLAVGSGLMWLGRTVGDSFAEVGDGRLHVKLGVFFDEVMSLSVIEKVEESRWSLLGGLGVRTDLRDLVAVTTKTGPVAEITFRRPQRLPVIPKIWSLDAKRLIVSPENLSGFIEELQAEIDLACGAAEDGARGGEPRTADDSAAAAGTAAAPPGAEAPPPTDEEHVEGPE